MRGDCGSLLHAVQAAQIALLMRYPFPYQTLSGVFATNSGIASHAALPHPLAPPKHVHHVWVWKGLWDHSVRPFRPNNTLPKTSPKIDFWPTLSPYAT